MPGLPAHFGNFRSAYLGVGTQGQWGAVGAT